MKRLLVLLSMSMLLWACSNDSSVTSQPTSNKSAAEQKLAAMMASGEFVGPQGQPVSEKDQAEILKIVDEACKGPGKVQALAGGPMQANPYLLAMVMKITNAQCPGVVAQAGIEVREP